MKTITHHPAPESLMSCAAGSMPEAFAAVMASHIALCPQCRKELDLMEKIGAAMFEGIVLTAVTQSAPIVVGPGGNDAPDGRPHIDAAPIGEVPAALVATLGLSLDRVAWKTVAPGVWQHQIQLSNDGAETLRLIKVSPGKALPEHGHSGSELTLVLRGSFKDGSRTYRAGDVADLAEDDAHAPISDAEEGCICLAASEGKMRFKSRIARLVQPLTGF